MQTIEHPIRHGGIIFVINRLSRLFGNLLKLLSYPFHVIFPKKRFTIPEYDLAKIEQPVASYGKISKIVWQTNYTNQVTLPVYCNYLINRLMSRDCDYRYISTEQREEMLRKYADEATFHAYSQLTDGAAQADFWRVFVLHQFGGIYLDIDAQLVCPLSWMVRKDDGEIIIRRKREYSNYFMAVAASNPLMLDTLNLIKDNIQQRNTAGGVFQMTGPITLMRAMENREVQTRQSRYTCVQGSFTNEYFQYFDKRNGKWVHVKHEDLLK